MRHAKINVAGLRGLHSGIRAIFRVAPFACYLQHEVLKWLVKGLVRHAGVRRQKPQLHADHWAGQQFARLFASGRTGALVTAALLPLPT